MRVSCSLQDFSAYQKVNIEDSGLLLGPNVFSSVQLHDGGATYNSRSPKIVPARTFTATTSWRSKWYWKVATGILFCFTVVFLIVLAFQWSPFHLRSKKLEYAIVLDCGSTSTRVHVYAWSYKHPHESEELPVVMHPMLQQNGRSGSTKNGRAYQRMETEPGFDKLLNNEVGLKNALEPLLQWAEGQVPASARRNTPLFLLATAGLRKLSASESEWILDKAWTILEKSSFMCRRTWVKVLSGIEEAYYGWVALNYNLGRLGYVPPHATVGALDLGGSSLQVTFESQEILHSEYELNLTVGSTEHHLYAYSHPRFGLNDAFDRSVAILLMQSNKNINAGKRQKMGVQHPCLHAGYKQRYKCMSCRHQSSPAGSYPVSRNAIDKETAVAVNLIGEPDWVACEKLALDVVNSSVTLDPLKCKEISCALGRYQPQPHGQFYALSGFFVVYKFFNLSPTAELVELLEKGEKFCSMTWKKAEKSVIPQPFVEQYCFRAPYVVSLLKEGLHLQEEQLIVGSGNITWTLGVALLEAGALLSSKIKSAAPRKSRLDVGQTKGLFILDVRTLTVFLFFLLLLLLVVVGFFRQTIIRFWRKSYLPLFSQPSSSSNPPAWLPPMLRSPLRLGRGTGLPPMRNGDGRYKLPLAPLRTMPDVYQQKHATDYMLANAGIPISDSSGVQSPPVQGALPFSARLSHHVATVKLPHKGNSQLQSRRTQSRDDLHLYVADNHNSKGVTL